VTIEAAPERRKGDKRERTRAALLSAAMELIQEQGYERTTLAEVAARASMTRGAIYGNFKNREDLFLAVVGTRWNPIVPRFRRGAPLQENMRALGEAVAAAVDERRRSALGAFSFMTYALTHEEMRERLARENAQVYLQAAEGLLRFARQEDLPLPAESFVRVLHALTDGLLYLRFLTPGLITDAVIVGAFEALAGGSPPAATVGTGGSPGDRQL
jgi:AcrR family transcriptional regulator